MLDNKESAAGAASDELLAAPHDISTVIVLLEAALRADNNREMRACVMAALDFARNDQDALAEGRLWADPPPVCEDTEGGAS